MRDMQQILPSSASRRLHKTTYKTNRRIRIHNDARSSPARPLVRASLGSSRKRARSHDSDEDNQDESPAEESGDGNETHVAKRQRRGAEVLTPSNRPRHFIDVLDHSLVLTTPNAESTNKYSQKLNPSSAGGKENQSALSLPLSLGSPFRQVPFQPEATADKRKQHSHHKLSGLFKHASVDNTGSRRSQGFARRSSASTVKGQGSKSVHRLGFQTANELLFSPTYLATQADFRQGIPIASTPIDTEKRRAEILREFTSFSFDSTTNSPKAFHKLASHRSIAHDFHQKSPDQGHKKVKLPEDSIFSTSLEVFVSPTMRPSLFSDIRRDRSIPNGATKVANAIGVIQQDDAMEGIIAEEILVPSVISQSSPDVLDLIHAMKIDDPDDSFVKANRPRPVWHRFKKSQSMPSSKPGDHQSKLEGLGIGESDDELLLTYKSTGQDC